MANNRHRKQKKIKGDVIETGCGNGETKQRILQKYGDKIHTYMATDYSSWDPLFANLKRKSDTLGLVTRIMYGKVKDIKEVDKVCSALKLPFKDRSFDSYCSFEVLEHIIQPKLYFMEAFRVLRKNGICVLSVPYMYREHSDGTGFDYFRYTKSGLTTLAEESGFKVKSIFAKSFFGTTLAAMVNGYVIRKIVESGVLVKSVLFICSPFIFIFTNVLDFLIDSIDHDERFATNFHVILAKLK